MTNRQVPIQSPGSFKIEISTSEMEYRRNGKYSDATNIAETKLLCTICGIHIKSRLVSDINIHPILKVLCCKKCMQFYKTRKQELTTSNSSSICQWCAKGKNIHNCNSCSAKFCQDCLLRNYRSSNRHVFRDIERHSWKCCFCEPTPIWPIRAVCASAKNYADTLHNQLEVRITSKRNNILAYPNSVQTVGTRFNITNTNSTAFFEGTNENRETIPRQARQNIEPKIFVSEFSNAAAASAVYEDSNFCVICMENPATMVLYKCGHACMCENCVVKIKSGNRCCPICREIFLDAIKLYKL